MQVYLLAPDSACLKRWEVAPSCRDMSADGYNQGHFLANNNCLRHSAVNHFRKRALYSAQQGIEWNSDISLFMRAVEVRCDSASG